MHVNLWLAAAGTFARHISASRFALRPGLRSASTCPCLYVSNTYGDSVTVYPISASGNTSPLRTIRGPKTKLRFPGGIAVDDSGRIYVSNGFATRVIDRLPETLLSAFGTWPKHFDILTLSTN